jgi:ketosteroid isomerase-like protein
MAGSGARMIEAPKRAVSVALVALSLAACDGRPHHEHVITAKVIDTIKAGEVRGAEDLKSGDPGKVLAHFAADAVVVVPGRAPIVGALALRKAVADDLQGPRVDLSFSSDRVDVPKSGEFAAAKGVYILALDDASKSSSGSYLALYRPAGDGRWLISWLIAAPGAPAASASAPAS